VPTVRGDYDAVWRATTAVLSRHGTIGAASREEAFMATKVRRQQWERSAGHSVPAQVHSTSWIEARFYKQADGAYEVRVRAYDQQSSPHKFRNYRGDAKPAEPEGRRLVVNYGETGIRSPLTERMLMEEIARELEALPAGAK